MDKWARKFDSCNNCNTIRYQHIAKGYCKRCYKVFKKIKNVEKWDITNPLSLSDCPLRDWRLLKIDRFAKLKEAYVAELKIELGTIKGRERKRSEDISGSDIEEQLTSLASYAVAKKKNIILIYPLVLTTILIQNKRKFFLKYLRE